MSDHLNLNLVDTVEAARRLGLSPYTLRRKRCEGTGPRYVKLGINGAIRYRVSDLEGWLIYATSTSEQAVYQHER
jgi:predicted DNA-binding transcriptional regulator AlpA